MIQFEYFPYRLQFKDTFRLSHSSRSGTDNVYLNLTLDGHSAWGECVFIPYYSETLSDFKQVISELQFPAGTENFDEFILTLRKKFPDKQFCIAAIDIALHNLHTAISGKNIRAQYGIIGEAAPCSFTLGISSFEEMRKKLEDNDGQAYYKLKVNSEEIARIVNNFRQLSDKTFTIDANQGFSDRKLALDWSYKLADLGVAYLEQPFHKDDFDSHKWLKARSPIPIIADESFQTYAELEKVRHYFDGVNLKVMKCGGISEGVSCLRRLAEMEMKSIIGCMSESTVVSDAAFQIAPLADWVDLDGPLLINNDPFVSENTEEDSLRILREFHLTSNL